MNSQKIYTTFYIIRHGEAESNTQKLFSGHLDTPLTSAGMNQAQQRAHQLDIVHFDAAFSSDLSRAKHTTEIIALPHRIGVKTRKILRERHWGTFEGKSRDDFRNMLEEFNQLPKQERFQKRLNPCMETSEEILDRFFLFLRETASIYPGKTILVGTHGNLMRTFLDHIDYRPYANNKVKHTEYFVLQSDGNDFFVKEIEG